MTWADLVIVIVCAVSAGIGYWRGLAKEAISLATWLAAIWLAWRFAWGFEPLLGNWLAAPELRLWVARLIIFVAVLALGGTVAWFVRELIRHSGLSGTDRSLGGMFGLFRGVLIVGICVIVMEFSGLDRNTWWQHAWLRPVFSSVAAGIRHYAELGGRYLEQQDLV